MIRPTFESLLEQFELAVRQEEEMRAFSAPYTSPDIVEAERITHRAYKAVLDAYYDD